MSEDKKDEEATEEKTTKTKKSFLASLKNNTLLLVGIMGALITLIGQIPKIVDEFNKSWSVFASPKKCITIEIEKVTRLPHYLIPSVGGSNDFPYWLRLEGKNDCKDVVSLVISFKGVKNVSEIDSSDIKKRFTISKDKPINKYFYPKLTLSNSEPKTIGLAWTIEKGVDGKGEILHEDDVETKITEAYTIDWDLRKPDNVSVEPKYLYASLSAWVRKPPREARDNIKGCKSNNHHAEAIKHCYIHLFHSDEAFSVVNKSIPFPKRPQQFIRPLNEIIESKSQSISSLEAGLLMSAILGANYNRRPDLFYETGMLITQNDNKPVGLKDIYLVWDDHNKWQGISMQQASQKGFSENKSATEAKLESLFDAEKARKEIMKSGVFINKDESLVLVKFKTAAIKHGIQPLRRIKR